MKKLLCLMIVLALAAVASATDLTAGLTAYYDFEASDATSSTGSHDGTVSGVSAYYTSPGQHGTYLRVGDGAYSTDPLSHSGVMTVADDSALDLTGAFTIGGWYRNLKGGATRWDIFYSKTDGSGQLSYRLETTGPPGSDDLNAVIKPYLKNQVVRAYDTAVYDGGWHWVGLRSSGVIGEFAEIFIDGAFAASQEITGVMSTSDWNLEVGRRSYYLDNDNTLPPNGAEYWYGDIDEFRIYNRRLTNNEMKQLREPATMCLLGLGGLALLRKKR